MKKLFILISTSLLFGKLSAQVIAGSVPSGMSITNPNIYMSLNQCNTEDSAVFEINCDGIPDFAIKLVKGYTPVDAPNFIQLYVLNDSVELCLDTFGISGGFNLQTVIFYSGDTIATSSQSIWSNDTLCNVATYGGFTQIGPANAANSYIGYRINGRVGWIEIPFTLDDASNCTQNITLAIPGVLSPCAPTGVNENYLASGISIYPNPATDLIKIEIENFVNAGELLVQNSLGQIVKHLAIYENVISIERDQLPAGIYFIQVKNEAKSIKSKLIIVD